MEVDSAPVVLAAAGDKLVDDEAEEAKDDEEEADEAGDEEEEPAKKKTVAEKIAAQKQARRAALLKFGSNAKPSGKSGKPSGKSGSNAKPKRKKVLIDTDDSADDYKTSDEDDEIFTQEILERLAADGERFANRTDADRDEDHSSMEEEFNACLVIMRRLKMITKGGVPHLNMIDTPAKKASELFHRIPLIEAQIEDLKVSLIKMKEEYAENKRLADIMPRMISWLLRSCCRRQTKKYKRQYKYE